MGVKNLSSMLPKQPTPKNYFDNKSVAVDFFNFAFSSAHRTGYDLVYRNSIESIFGHFKRIMQKLLKQKTSKVFLILDGDLLPGKAPVSLPRMIKREDFRNQISSQKSKQEIEKLCVKGFTITKDQKMRLFSSLVEHFQDRRFQVICAPAEADFQIQHMVEIGVVDCILSNDSDMALLGVDVIQDFNTRQECFISAKQGQILIDSYGGIIEFTKCCILKGNDYFPGFDFSFKQIFQFLKSNNYDILRTAFQLNEQSFRMSKAKIVKCIYLAYALQYYCTIFDYSTQTVKYLNDISEPDQVVLRSYFQRDILGKLYGQEKSIQIISCNMLSGVVGNAGSVLIQRYKEAYRNSFYRSRCVQNIQIIDILCLLNLVKDSGSIYKNGNNSIDFSDNSFHVDFLLKYPAKYQERFNFQQVGQEIEQDTPQEEKINQKAPVKQKQKVPFKLQDQFVITFD